MMHWWISSTPLLVSLIHTSDIGPCVCCSQDKSALLLRVLYEVCGAHYVLTCNGAFICSMLICQQVIDCLPMRAEAEGALEAFVSVISGPPGPRPEAIFDRVSGPILLLWGQRDEVTPLDGPVAKFMKAAADSRPHTQFKIMQGTSDPPCLHRWVRRWCSKGIMLPYMW